MLVCEGGLGIDLMIFGAYDLACAGVAKDDGSLLRRQLCRRRPGAMIW